MTDFDRWIEQNISSQTGKTALITGANSGLGFEAAKVLAGKGAAVTLAVRDTAKGEKAAADDPCRRAECRPGGDGPRSRQPGVDPQLRRSVCRHLTAGSTC